MALAVIFMAACSINDVPASPPADAGNDGTIDAADASDATTFADVVDGQVADVVNDAGAEAAACDASTQTDPANCGTCGHACLGSDGGGAPYCSSGTCGVKSTTSSVPGYWSNAPTLSTFPFLAMWHDSLMIGTTNVDLVTGAKTADWLLGGALNQADFALANRPSVQIQQGTSKGLITHKAGPNQWGYTTPQFTDWASGFYGCCDYTVDTAVSIDAAAGYWYWNGQYRASLTTGMKISEITTGWTGGFSGSEDYYTAVHGNIVYKSVFGAVRRSDFGTLKVDWNVNVGSVNSAPMGVPIIVSSNDDVAIASSAGEVAVVKGDATGTILWAKPFTSFSVAPLRPLTVVTGPVSQANAPKGLILQTTGDSKIIAFRVNDGTTAWTYVAPGRVDELLVGDNGLAYAFVRSTSTVYGIDVATGTASFAYGSLPSGSLNAADMMLRSGRLYLNFNGMIISFPVPSTRYDPTSLWPTRFHDNQRTSCLTSPMSF